MSLLLTRSSRSIRAKIILGFGISLLMLAIIAGSASRSTKAFTRAAQEVAQSLIVLELQAHFQGQILQAENAVRGFLMEAEPSNLKPLEDAEASIAKDFSLLEEATAKNPLQSQRIQEAGALETKKLALLRRAVTARKMLGMEAAAAVIAGQDHFALDAELKKVFESFGQEEHWQLEKRKSRTEAIARTTTVAIVVATTFAVLLLFSAGVIILKDIKARRQAEEALIEEHHLLLSVMDAIPDQVYVTDLDGNCIINNAAHREFLNYSQGSLEFDSSPDERDLIRAGSVILNSESPLILHDGQINWLSRSKIPLKDTDGNVIGLVGVNADISERKAAEEKLWLAARQMERSNRDLQDFASVASHDLQEPLRKILAFGDRLRVKCNDALGENGRDYLERMTNAAERMQKLIQSLLTLSRVTSKAVPFELVDLHKIAEEVVSDLEVRIEQTGAQVLIGALPKIEADPNQMRQLFQNLIANALKFQKPGSRPEVSLQGKIVEAQEDLGPQATAGSKVCQIFVSDNGIGFDQKFAERIFVVFQRLHGRLEYEGTGIGLSVCRRITERHGGSIRAKSQEGSGATFIVTLPIKQLMKEESYETR
jgi:signal transduction histidine kinase